MAVATDPNCIFRENQRTKEEFTKKYGGGKVATAVANSLNRKFGWQYCVDHPDEISKLAKVKAQVSEVKGVMMESIEKVLVRGKKIELLVDKTENLRLQAKGTRFQDARNNNEEEDVVAEHEDQAYSFGDYYCLDSDHSFVSMWRFQMSLVRFLILTRLDVD
ncbi:hypothetical protein RND71_034855 [Anisodus tanguticus]|uniref:V-SNARE coiled-coil homology domain-containing protein n=1 Tax=Anisodus tanguticus TaxID=243964 RepID=A0AAE1V105_9SOLA|nr:hypothetical protein RND71_034855 [Anisodus tanguticus]